MNKRNVFLILLTLFLALQAPLSLLSPKTVQAGNTVKSGTYVLHPKGNDAHSLAVEGKSTAARANIVVSQILQTMTVTSLNHELYVISPTCSSLALDCQLGKTGEGTNVWQYPFNETIAQKWKIVSAGGAYYKILSAKNSAMALTVSKGNLELRKDSGANSQLFRFEMKDAGRTVPNASYTMLLSKNTKQVLDVQGGKTTKGSNIQIYQSNDTLAQKFHVKYLGAGNYEILSAKSGLALDVSGGRAASGTNVQLWTRNHTKAQHWKITEYGATGSFLFQSALGEFALDAKGGKTESRTNIQIYKRNDTPAQRFFLRFVKAPAQPPAATSGSAPASSGTQLKKNGHKVAINAGHQRKGNAEKEPIGPGASQTKAKCTSGTYGKWSKLEEYELNLQVANRLKAELESRGYEVCMIRTSHDVNLSNAERAQMANRSGAEILINLHGNGLENSAVRGAMVYQPSASNRFMSSALISKSQKLASLLLTEECKATGLPNKGILTGDDMTSINWSAIPVAIVEMGFMSNQTDDLYMASAAGQQAIAKGLANAVDRYFG